jgi:hypothetical protein
MSNQQTDELTRALRDRSEDMSGTHVAFEDVKGRARGIRRRRRTASGIVVAAVALAVAVPLGIDLDGVDRGQRPLPADQPTTTTDPTGQAEPEGPFEVDAAKARRGEDPAILFQTRSTLHRPGGPDVELPRAYTWVAPFGEGWVGLDGADGTTTILGPDGKVSSPPWPGQSAATSSDGRSLATVVYAGGGNVDMQLWETADASLDKGYGSHVVAFEGNLQYAGFVGPETVAYNLTVNGNQGATVTPYVADWYSSDEPRELTSVVDVRGANDVTGVVSGMTKIDDLNGEYCAAVVKAEPDTVVWETCEYRLGRFSPDGQYVLGVDPQSDGIGGHSVTMLDAEDGDVVAEFTVPDRSFMQDAVWESRSTALVPVMQDGAWFLVRLRPDGTVEKALEPSREGYDDSSPWRFQVTP